MAATVTVTSRSACGGGLEVMVKVASAPSAAPWAAVILTRGRSGSKTESGPFWLSLTQKSICPAGLLSGSYTLTRSWICTQALVRPSVLWPGYLPQYQPK